MTAKQLPVRPEWGDIQKVDELFGLTKSVVYRLIEDGKIRTVSLRDRGKVRGKRLVDLDSVARFLESRATGGEGGAA